METRRILQIEKRPLPFWLVMCIFALPLLWGTIFQLLSLPAMFKYTADVAWVGLAVLLLWHPHIQVEKKVVPLVVLVAGFFLYCLFTYLFNFQSIVYFLWGFRNNFRFYIFFFAVVLYVQERDADKLFGLLEALFWINFPVTLIQYFGFGFAQDELGGIFGVESGANAFTILFFTIILSRSLLRYMEREEPFILCALKCSVAFFISALAEIKFFFVFFVVILLMSAFLTSFSWRKVLIFLVCAVLVSVASSMLVSLFGFEDFMSIEKIWENATQDHYSSDETVNRLSAISTLSNTIVPDAGDHWFGMGLGNCDTSTFEACNTPFFRMYGYLKYSFFSVAFLFLEVGYVGLVLYVAFFTVCAILIWRRMRQGLCDPLYGRIALIMAVLAHVLVVYNAVLRTEAGYLVFFILALPFLVNDDDTDDTDAIDAIEDAEVVAMHESS